MFEHSGLTSAVKSIKNTLAYSLKNNYNIDDEQKVDAILKTHGLAKDHFDFIANMEKIISNNLNDVSIDDNSNKNEKTMAGIHAEVSMPINKVVGYRYLYRQMVDMYGKEKAKNLSGRIYDYSLALADSSKIMIPYCFSIDASKLVLFGRDFGTVKSGPAKRVSSYIAQLNEVIHQLSNHVAGALAIGTLFMDIAHVMIFSEKITLNELKSNVAIRKYIENSLQSFVHSVNHLSRNAVESPFTNISIFDRPKLKTLISDDDMGWYFEGVERDYAIEYIIELQKIFLDFFDRGDPLAGGLQYRFPVVTVNISKKVNGETKILDKEFFDDVTKREIYKYNIYSSEGTKVASCCFDKDQKVLIRNSEDKEQLVTIKVAIDDIPNNSNTKVFHNGFWKHYSKVKIPYSQKMLKITTENNKQVIVTPDHIFPTFNGDKQSKDITTEDYLMFNTNASAMTQKYSPLTYEQGFLIGAFLGDGSYNSFIRNGARYYAGITLSLNANCIDIIRMNIEKAINDFGITANISIYPSTTTGLVSLVVHSVPLANKLLEYIPHNTAESKQFVEELYGQSIECRNGIIDGLYETDGGNSNRIYSTSTILIEQIETLLTTLGRSSVINVVDRTGEIEFHGKIFNRNYPLYCIRYYEKTFKSKDLFYRWHNNSLFFKIKSIEEIDNSEDNVYCFEIKNDEPYFTLPNGIISHNCRLINDTELMEMGSTVNSFGGTNISLGSHRVVTININRIALEATSYENYLQILKERTFDAGLILKAHKELIRDLTDKGLQPFVKKGWLRLDRMFSTFGILGEVEAGETLKSRFKDVPEDPVADTLQALSKYVKEISKEIGVIGNIEQIPAESMAVRLAEIDKLFYGKEAVPYELYANQFIPLWEDATLWDRMDADGKYNKLLSGGSICHFGLGEKVTAKQAKKIIEYAIDAGSEHFALNVVYSQCEDEHVTFGNSETCPTCGKKIVEKYTRVVGFLTPVSSWNKTRRTWEFPKRQFRNVD